MSWTQRKIFYFLVQRNILLLKHIVQRPVWQRASSSHRLDNTHSDAHVGAMYTMKHRSMNATPRRNTSLSICQHCAACEHMSSIDNAVVAMYNGAKIREDTNIYTYRSTCWLWWWCNSGVFGTLNLVGDCIVVSASC